MSNQSNDGNLPGDAIANDAAGDNSPSDIYAEWAELYEDLPHYEVSPKTRRRKAMTGQRRAEIAATLGGRDMSSQIVFTFKAARFEEDWLLAYLRVFYDDQLITDVLREAKAGKEANVYCCRAHPRTGLDLAAVKVYRPRRLRNLRNDAQYRAGRVTLDDQGKGVLRARREKLALAKKTRFGKDLQHGSWLGHEYQTMQRLYAAGADIPRPIGHSDNAILMEFIGDEQQTAPTLNGVGLQPAEARWLFDRLLRNVGLMLEHDRVHADLSAYNVLYWEGDVKMIDFPQAVDPYVNPDAYPLFARDVQRLCQYFAHYGIRAEPATLAADLWRRHTSARGP